MIYYLSNYPEMALHPSMSATCVIRHMKLIFDRHGIPQIVYSDNGPYSSCKEFEDFAAENDFRHGTSSPIFTQSNKNGKRSAHSQTITQEGTRQWLRTLSGSFSLQNLTIGTL